MSERTVILTGLTQARAEQSAFLLAGVLNGAVQYHSGPDGWSVSVRSDEEQAAGEVLRKAGLRKASG